MQWLQQVGLYRLSTFFYLLHDRKIEISNNIYQRIKDSGRWDVSWNQADVSAHISQ